MAQIASGEIAGRLALRISPLKIRHRQEHVPRSARLPDGREWIAVRASKIRRARLVSATSRSKRALSTSGVSRKTGCPTVWCSGTRSRPIVLGRRPVSYRRPPHGGGSPSPRRRARGRPIPLTLRSAPLKHNLSGRHGAQTSSLERGGLLLCRGRVLHELWCARCGWRRSCLARPMSPVS
jgi:hypothetical protein